MQRVEKAQLAKNFNSIKFNTPWYMKSIPLLHNDTSLNPLIYNIFVK